MLFVRWQHRCEPADVEAIRVATEDAHREVGGNLVYVASIPVGVPPPDTKTRTALRAGTEHASQRCASVHLIIEGQGLRRAIIRSVSAGLLLATRASFLVHTDATQALRAAGERVPLDVEKVLAAAKDAGMVSP